MNENWDDLEWKGYGVGGKYLMLTIFWLEGASHGQNRGDILWLIVSS